MDREAIKEKLKYYNSLKTNFWATFVILTGSLATMSMNSPDLHTKILISVGVFWDFVLFLLLSVCIAKISLYIKALDRSYQNE